MLMKELAAVHVRMDQEWAQRSVVQAAVRDSRAVLDSCLTSQVGHPCTLEAQEVSSRLKCHTTFISS